jgi:hypothetical protein
VTAREFFDDLRGQSQELDGAPVDVEMETLIEKRGFAIMTSAG